MSDLYSRMGDELRSLFVDLFDPKRKTAVRQKMARILSIASQIGGPLQKEAERLDGDVAKFLERPSDLHLQKVLKEHALRLEEETREI